MTKYNPLFRWFAWASVKYETQAHPTSGKNNRDRSPKQTVVRILSTEKARLIMPRWLLLKERYAWAMRTLIQAWVSHKSFSIRGMANSRASINFAKPHGAVCAVGSGGGDT